MNSNVKLNLNKAFDINDNVLKHHLSVMVKNIYACSNLDGSYFIDLRAHVLDEVGSDTNNCIIGLGTPVLFDDSVSNFCDIRVLQSDKFRVMSFSHCGGQSQNAPYIDIRLRKYEDTI